ncbi:MAG: hypothetical protein FJX72_12295, partial [Armatimonadetes bacterium]|nr:hypothetical protein [Armatimonadota bacterium]
MTQTEARRFLEQAMAHSQADDTVLTLSGSRESSTRFANNAITQNVSKTDTTITVEAAFGNRVGIARTNQLTPEAVSATVARAEEIARSAAPNSEYMPPIEPCALPAVLAWADETAQADPGLRARGIRAAISVAEREGAGAAGSFATESGLTALLNNRGMFAYHRETDARFICTAITDTSSGWAESASVRVADVDPAEVAEAAVLKAIRSRG